MVVVVGKVVVVVDVGAPALVVVDVDALVVIDAAAERFSSTTLQTQLYFSILYLCMVAEQNYPNTKLGKRLKRLGIYQLLFEGMTVEEAANWSRGKPWRDIAHECEKRGF